MECVAATDELQLPAFAGEASTISHLWRSEDDTWGDVTGTNVSTSLLAGKAGDAVKRLRGVAMPGNIWR